MPFTPMGQSQMRHQFDSLLRAWYDTSLREERSFLLSVHEVFQSVWHVADLPGLNPNSPEQFRQMLDLGATETASLRLLSADSAYMLSRGSEGLHMATVVLAGHDVEASASARTAGLAVSGAILLSLTDRGGGGLLQQNATLNAWH